MAPSTTAFSPRRRAPVAATLGLVGAAMIAAFGCQPASSPGQPILTNAGEILMAATQATVALHSVHARIDLTAQGLGGQGGGPVLRWAVDADVDLATRSFAARAVTGGMGGPDQTSDLIFVGGQQFTRIAPATRWTQIPNFGGGPTFPSNDEVVAAIAATIDSSGAVLQLVDPEPCGELTCYHVIAEVDGTVTWALIGPVLTGAPGPPPAGFAMPPVTIHLLVDRASRLLVGANTVVTIQGSSLAVALNLTNHDVPLQIVPPNPALVDQMDMNFGGGIIHGGEPIPPVASAEPSQVR